MTKNYFILQCNDDDRGHIRSHVLRQVIFRMQYCLFSCVVVYMIYIYFWIILFSILYSLQWWDEDVMVWWPLQSVNYYLLCHLRNILIHFQYSQISQTFFLLLITCYRDYINLIWEYDLCYIYCKSSNGLLPHWSHHPGWFAISTSITLCGE